MTVTDGDRLAVAVAKFDEAASLVQQGRKIIEYLFETGESNVEIPERSGIVSTCVVDASAEHGDDPCDPVTGLYPGQKGDPATLIQQEDEETECLE
jgi:hypothetical protein